MEIIINCLEGEQKEIATNGVRSVIEQTATNLDLSNLESIIFPENFEGELLAFQKRKGLREGFTNEEHGRAFGKTLNYFVGEELKSTVFLDSAILLGLYTDERKQFCAHIIHHELCHVHDETTKANDFGSELVMEMGRDLQTTLYVHADSIWSEYAAVRLSYGTTDFSGEDHFYLKYFFDLLPIVKNSIEEQKPAFVESQDWMGLFKFVQQQSNLLLRIAVTVLANMHVMNNEELDLTFYELMEKTYLEPIWNNLNKELEKLFESFGKWGDVSAYTGLCDAIQRVWNDFGVHPYEMTDGSLYIGVD